MMRLGYFMNCPPSRMISAALSACGVPIQYMLQLE